MSYDTGDKAIQCGRHNDIFKFWLMWRARGDFGFEAQIDYLMDMSRLLEIFCTFYFPYLYCSVPGALSDAAQFFACFSWTLRLHSVDFGTFGHT